MKYRQRLVNAVPHSPRTVMYQLKEGVINEQQAGQLLGQMIVANRAQVNALGNQPQGNATQAAIERTERKIDTRKSISCQQIHADGCTVRVQRGGLEHFYFVRNGSESARRIGQLLGVL